MRISLFISGKKTELRVVCVCARACLHTRTVITYIHTPIESARSTRLLLLKLR